MREKLEGDREARDNFINELELPRYDGEENPSKVLEELLASKDDKEDQEARAEAEKKR